MYRKRELAGTKRFPQCSQELKRLLRKLVFKNQAEAVIEVVSDCVLSAAQEK